MKIRHAVSAVIMFSLVLSIGCSNKEKEQAGYEKKPIKVKVERVQRGTFTKQLNFKGTVLPWKRANIGPDVSGRIAKIYKKPGDVVQAGALLAELDTTTMQLQEKQLEAALAVALASYNDALLNFERIEKLYQKKAASQMQYEKARLNLEAAETQKKSAEANLNVVRHTLSNSYMRAPFAGIITSKNREEGDVINPMMGMNASVLTLMDLRRVKIAIDVPAEDIEKVQIGQECRVSVDSLQGEIFAGRVYSKNLAADPLSKTFQVEVVVENPATKIKAGVFAEMMIEIQSKENVLFLPHAAVIEERYVVLYDNGRARTVKVEIGDRSEQYYEILDGLAVGQLVVVEGNYDLKEGALISYAPESTENEGELR